MSEFAQWVEKLNRMSAEDIRKLMQQEGIVGRRGDSGHCPIARFLLSKCGNRATVSVNGAYAVCIEFGEEVGFREHCLPLSGSVATFVINFDRGNYPELDMAKKLQALYSTTAQPTMELVSA